MQMTDADTCFYIKSSYVALWSSPMLVISAVKSHKTSTSHSLDSVPSSPEDWQLHNIRSATYFKIPSHLCSASRILFHLVAFGVCLWGTFFSSRSSVALQNLCMDATIAEHLCNKLLILVVPSASPSFTSSCNVWAKQPYLGGIATYASASNCDQLMAAWVNIISLSPSSWDSEMCFNLKGGMHTITSILPKCFHHDAGIVCDYTDEFIFNAKFLD